MSVTLVGLHKHTGLAQYKIYYGRKKFYDTGPGNLVNGLAPCLIFESRVGADWRGALFSVPHNGLSPCLIFGGWQRGQRGQVGQVVQVGPKNTRVKHFSSFHSSLSSLPSLILKSKDLE